jgi:IS30 family transposase
MSKRISHETIYAAIYIIHQGRETACHESWVSKLSLKAYFADPNSPWQRGSNENTNCLLRQYLPRGTNLAALSQRELNVIAEHLNNRSRQALDWMTSNEAWVA